MTKHEWNNLAAEVIARMKDAEAGGLVFVRGEGKQRHGDVDQMTAAPTVLEIRYNTTTGTRSGKRRVRLYFTEPEELSGTLVALKAASKYPGAIGLDEQTAHATESAVRADAHVAQNL